MYSGLYDLYAFLSEDGELCFIDEKGIKKIAEAGHQSLYCFYGEIIWYEVKNMHEPISTWYILKGNGELKEIVSYRELQEN